MGRYRISEEIMRSSNIERLKSTRARPD